jgi:hypothetical protein
MVAEEKLVISCGIDACCVNGCGTQCFHLEHVSVVKEYNDPCKVTFNDRVILTC